MDPIDKLIKTPPEKFYWIFTFPYYYQFVFYGTASEAQDLFKKKCQSEGSGTLRLADPDIPAELEFVREEIINVRLDRESGIPNLPVLPGKGWV